MKKYGEIMLFAIGIYRPHPLIIYGKFLKVRMQLHALHTHFLCLLQNLLLVFMIRMSGGKADKLVRVFI